MTKKNESRGVDISCALSKRSAIMMAKQSARIAAKMQPQVGLAKISQKTQKLTSFFLDWSSIKPVE